MNRERKGNGERDGEEDRVIKMVLVGYVELGYKQSVVVGMSVWYFSGFGLEVEETVGTESQIIETSILISIVCPSRVIPHEL